MRKTIEWKEEYLVMIDQRKLPQKLEILVCTRYEQVKDAIKNMAVRGAPAIGAAAAYGMVLAAKNIKKKDRDEFIKNLESAKNELLITRPTAVNLYWALNEIWNIILKNKNRSIVELQEKILMKANEIALQDINSNIAMGEHGARLFNEGDAILTHCNAGSLATVYYGTALGVIRAVFKDKKDIVVYVDETRPVLQGARLTAWELRSESIPVILICDSVAGYLMSKGEIDKVIVGADRIAANGDVANKIGTYTISVLAKENKIPFYVAAPFSTIDLNIKNGFEIPIEERNHREVTEICNKQIAPKGIKVYNPAFDITPNKNVTAIITEKGIIYPPFSVKFKKYKK